MTEGFPELVRAVAVGRVGPRGARLWLRSPGGGPHRLELWPQAVPGAPRVHALELGDRSASDHCHAFDFPEDVPGAQPLEPTTRYGFRLVRADGLLVGEGRFETTPARGGQMPQRFCIGVASCHQPFDDEGHLHEQGRRMLQLARIAWERCDAKLVLWTGDQMYVDYPPRQSLFHEEYFRTIAPPGRRGLLECTPEETLAIYHARYRRCWAQPEWQALLARFPAYPILDDHEVVDNFGSLPEHHTEDWRNIRMAAGASYRHYQHWLVEDSPSDGDGPYDYQWEYGAAAGYVLDVRSARRSRDGAHARIFAREQLEGFAAWLNANAHAPVLFVTVSVPPFFMPEWASRIATRLMPGSFSEDAHDRWMHPQYRKDRSRLLELIRSHQQRQPRQKVVLVCGDVHVGYATRCEWRTEPFTALYQFVSSSITHRMKSLDWHVARHVPRTHFLLTDVGDRWARIHLTGGRLSRLFEQPVSGLNVGTIEVDLTGEEARLKFQLFGEDPERPDEPKCLYASAFE